VSAALDAPFQLSLLGHFSLAGPRGPIDLGNRKLCALLAFVTCATESPSRETLTTLLWGSHFDTQARHNLRQALTRLRRALGEDVFISSDNALAIRPGLFHCDAVQFEALIQAESRAIREIAVDLYEGAFLANVAITEETWTNWITAQRQRLEDLAVDGLIRLGEEEEKHGASEQALAFAERAVALNDLREDGHRLIIRSLAAVGRYTEAHGHYDQLAARLKHHLNVEPDATTTALVATTTGVPTQQDVIQTTAVSQMPSLHGMLPSIAVLPLQNLSGDAGDDYFADGIVEDIVVSLASLRELLVISRSSTLVFRGRPIDPRAVGRTLGVRYVLEGSVRKSAASMRISTQLCDTETGANLWAERQEIALGDLFEVQDHIVRNIVAGIIPNVRTAELARALRTRPTSFTAYDHTLRALNIIHSPDRQTFLSARDHLDKAMDAHPGFAMPAAWIAYWYIIWIGQGWSDSPADDANKAAAFATTAVSLDRHNALALATHGHVRSFLLHDYDSALMYLDRALSACPNNSLAWTLSGANLAYVGRGAEGVRHAEHGLRLSPYDRSLYFYHSFLSIAHYGSGNYEEAVKWSRLSAAENPTFTSNLRMLITALAALDRLDEARDVASTLLKLEPDFRLSVYERTRQPFRQPEIKVRLMEHLRRAGLPP